MEIRPFFLLQLTHHLLYYLKNAEIRGGKNKKKIEFIFVDLFFNEFCRIYFCGLAIFVNFRRTYFCGLGPKMQK